MVREWVESGELSKPEGTKLFDRKNRDLKNFELGCDLKPFSKDEKRFDELRSMYAGRDYLLEVEGDDGDAARRGKEFDW